MAELTLLNLGAGYYKGSLYYSLYLFVYLKFLKNKNCMVVILAEHPCPYASLLEGIPLLFLIAK